MVGWSLLPTPLYIAARRPLAALDRFAVSCADAEIAPHPGSLVWRQGMSEADDETFAGDETYVAETADDVLSAPTAPLASPCVAAEARRVGVASRRRRATSG